MSVDQIMTAVSNASTHLVLTTAAVTMAINLMMTNTDAMILMNVRKVEMTALRFA
jgi:predicted tellurium resistance membrane protein TerC